MSSASTAAFNHPELSAREIEVALGIMAGETADEIGVRLELNYETVRSYMKRLRAKTGLRRKPLLAVWAMNEERWLKVRLATLKKKEGGNGTAKRI